MPVCSLMPGACFASCSPTSLQTGSRRESSALAEEPSRLAAMAAAARKVGRLDAAERLADLVMRVARLDLPVTA